MGHRCQMPKNYRQGKFVSNWTKMGRTSSEKVVLRVVGHCAGIPKNNSGQFGTKWTKMKRTPYEWIVFERFLDAEKWQPGPVCHQMDKYRGESRIKMWFLRGSGTPGQVWHQMNQNGTSTLLIGCFRAAPRVPPNEPKWDEFLTKI